MSAAASRCIEAHETMAKRNRTRTPTRSRGSQTQKPVRAAYKAPFRDAKAKESAGRLRLPRAAKGRRAQFYEDPAIDQLMGIVTALTAELSVAFERIATLERVLARHGRVDLAEIESYEPDEQESSDRAVARESLIERVFQVLEVTDAIR